MNNDETIRLKSSSGGVFTVLAEQVIDNGGVVFGAAFDESFELRHCYVGSRNELEKLRGSKYLQSEIGSTYKQTKFFLDAGKKVLFSGTPCQIGGLKSYLGKSYKALVCVDMICHGVPSPDVWSKYIKFREKKAGSSVQRIAFRCKDEGWKRYSISYLFKNDTEYREPRDKDLYMRAFLKDVCLRPSCYDCGFKGLHRQSDITLADFWGIENVLPEMDDDKGTSLIFINSGRGKDLFNKTKGKMLYQEVNINEAVKYNSSAYKSTTYNPKRDGFMAEKDVLAFDQLIKKYCTDELSIRVKRKIKSDLRKTLIKTGLLEVVKSVFGKNSSE